MCPFADDNGKLAFVIEPMADFGVMTASPQAMTLVDGFKKSSGSGGNPSPISSAWAR